LLKLDRFEYSINLKISGKTNLILAFSKNPLTNFKRLFAEALSFTYYPEVSPQTPFLPNTVMLLSSVKNKLA
jgi:hypothetical protein